MRRRGNKSTKVPGVKLRPADPDAMRSRSTHSIEEDCLAPETQIDSDDTIMFDHTPRPFKGVVICATGVPDKPTLFKQAVELGAACTPAFTDRVTHLVAVDHGGPKYTCALERKIPIMRPSWITESYQTWLRGDDVYLETSMDGHRLPIFIGVTLCPSGIADMARRTRISQIITQHQGTYLNKLERPVRVTHLLCSSDEQTDKMKYAEKFNAKGEASIHIIWEEWFWDCLAFGGRFDEQGYSIKNPRPEPRTSPRATSPPSSSQPSSQFDAIPSSSAPQPPTRTSNRQGPPPNQSDEPEDEPAFTNVLPNVTLQLWSSLLGRRGFEVVDGEVILSPTKKKPSTSRPLNDPPSPIPANDDPGLRNSVISSFRRANSFAPTLLPRDDDKSRVPAPFRRVQSSAGVLAAGGSKTGGSQGGNAVASSSRRPAVAESAGSKTASSPGSNAEAEGVVQIFTGMTFRPMGEAKTAAVRTAIEQRGGRIIPDEDEDVDFIIVRLVSGSKIYRQEEEAMKVKYRTECWLEQCIYEDRICPTEGHVTFIPLAVDIPIGGTEKILLSMSGFDESESCGIKRLLRALGIALAPTFSRKSSYLLCPSGTGPKFDKAHEWGIPVVGMAWLSVIATKGCIPPATAPYIVPGPPSGDSTSPAVDRKGKGRAVSSEKDVEMAEADTKIKEITNTTPPDEQPSHTNTRSKPDKPTTTRTALRIATAVLERQSTVIVPTSAHPKTPSKPKQSITAGDTLLDTDFQTPNGSSSALRFPGYVPSSIRTISNEPTPHIEYFEGVRSNSASLSVLPSIIPNQNVVQALDAAETSNLKFKPDPTSALQAYRSRIDMDDDAVIPSSKSPSPMKGPPLHGQTSAFVRTSSTSSISFGEAAGGRRSVSPVKMDPQVTKALKDSITTLLGKRSSPDDDSAPGAAPAVAGGAAGGGIAAEGSILPNAGGAAGGGRAKRPRPQRSKKNLANDASEQTLDSVEPARVTRSTRATTTTTTTVTIDLTLDNSQSQKLVHASQDVQESSIRVQYEDPHAEEERCKLMDMLRGLNAVEESQGSVASAGGTRRRRARKSKS